jgi:hypothetical protein
MSMGRKIHPRNCLIFVAKSEFLSRPLPPEASVALMENFQLGSVARLLEENGYAALTPGWPDDPETVEEAKAHPEVFAGKSIGQVADHFEAIIRGLDRKPAVIGHSFGGLLTQILAKAWTGRCRVGRSETGWQLTVPSITARTELQSGSRAKTLAPSLAEGVEGCPPVGASTPLHRL